MGCFYDKGLKFSCQGCNYCCGSEPGYVFLSESDRKALADGLDMTVGEFTQTYCRKIDMGAFYMISLIEKENFDCIFLTQNGCSVYPYRPKQCRTYPFWANVMESREAWDAESKCCPGIGKGKIHTRKEIEQRLDAKLSNPPIIILK